MTVHIEKYRSLIEKLFTRTQQKKLSWAIDAIDGAIQTSVGTNIIDISEDTNSSGEPIVVVKIFARADLTDQFDDETVKGKSPGIIGYSSYFELMNSLYELAKRQASGVDEVLDSILAELDNDLLR